MEDKMTEEQKKIYEVGKAFLTPVDERSGEQYEVTDEGICWAFERSGIPDMIPEIITGVKSYFHWLPTRTISDQGFTPECDQIRGMLCMLWALMPEKDYLELRGQDDE